MRNSQENTSHQAFLGNLAQVSIDKSVLDKYNEESVKMHGKATVDGGERAHFVDNPGYGKEINHCPHCGRNEGEEDKKNTSKGSKVRAQKRYQQINVGRLSPVKSPELSKKIKTPVIPDKEEDKIVVFKEIIKKVETEDKYCQVSDNKDMQKLLDEWQVSHDQKIYLEK